MTDSEKPPAVDSEHQSLSLEPPEVPEPARSISGVPWVLTVTVLYISAMLYGLDTTIVADVQVPIIKDFGHIDQLTWIGAGFPLGSVAVILPVGVLYGLFNVKWVYLSSIFMFQLGSAICGSAPNMNALIVGRVIAGIGGAGTYLGGLNFFAALTTIHERPIYTAGIGLLWGLGAILGPVIGGSFATSSATWRWSFYINLVIAGVIAPIWLFILPSVHRYPELSIRQKLERLDWLGTILNAGSYTSWILALTFAGGVWAWDDGRTIATFIVFGIVLITYIITQYFAVFTTPENRLFPAQFLRSRSLVLLHICTAAVSTNLFIPIYYIPLYFQFTHGDSSLHAAVRLLPFIFIGVGSTMFSGIMMSKFGYYMPFYVLSGVTSIIGGSLMYTVKANTSTANVYGYSILCAVGAGSALQAAYSAASAKVEPKHVPAAIGFMNMAQLGGTTIALTIAGQIFQSFSFMSVKNALQGLGFSDAEVHAAIAGVQSDLLANVSPQVREHVLEGIVEAIDKVYVLIIAGGALTLVLSVFLKREKLFLAGGSGGG
ncbi:MFS multidrug transporter-like protein [Stipitochalara longipes BDJ]|nr:MFS multidrug transporter-like protein [Stipitochalara longipes BDJ]